MRSLVTALALLISGGAVMGEEKEKKFPDQDTINKLMKMAESLTNTAIVKGKVASVDSAQKQLAVKGEDNKETKLAVDGSTTIKLNDKDAKLSDLREGDETIVLFSAKEANHRALTILCARR